MTEYSSGAGAFLSLWCLSAVMVLGRFDGRVAENVRVVSPPVDCVLAPDWAWSVPLGRIVDGTPISELPVWIFAPVCGAAIAWVAVRITTALGIAAGLIGLAGWSLAVDPHDLVPGIFVMAIASTFRWNPKENVRKLAASIACLAAAVLVTLEFGFLCLYAGSLFWPAVRKRLGSTTSLRTVGTVTVPVVGGLIAAALLHSTGFAAALLRPINWIWIRPSLELLPSMGFALTTPDGWPSHLLLCCSLIMCWRQWLVSRDDRCLSVATLLLFSCVGLGCGRLLWLATFALAATTHGMPNPILTARRDRLLFAACCAMALVNPLAHLPDISREVLGVGAPPRRVAPHEWSMSGPVMLMNLDQSSDWQSADIHSRHKLLLNDRWDVFGDFYPDYIAACRDVAEIRSDSYLRTDGRWGGYQRWLRRWEPVLLVTDSNAVEDIRRLSMSPHWKILGIDGRRTVFGRADDPQARPAMQRAGATLSRLEWPGLLGTALDANVIVVHEADEYRRAASVLEAIRLPCAALRVLRAGPQAVSLQQEAACYLELSHRAGRYSGTASLLDQVRAVSRARRISRSMRMDPGTRLRMAYGLSGLGLHELAGDIAASVHSGASSWWASSDQRRQASSLATGRSAVEPSDHAPSAPKPGGVSETEVSIRRSLEQGDVAACRPLLDQLELPARPFYSMLVAAADASTAQSLTDLRSVLERPDFPVRLRGEAWFYLGCLATEIGDPPTAATAFSRSAEFEPSSPFAPLRTMFLRQIAGS
ncbi:MAG: hypothetical protein H7062_14000 [Candidatus Saccharimonas sp.]|nr:hypothetical protein [Planctomycetaceae bacterium]